MLSLPRGRELYKDIMDKRNFLGTKYAETEKLIKANDRTKLAAYIKTDFSPANNAFWESLEAMAKFQNDNYGSQFFPTLSSVQSSVFEKSFLGPQIKKYASFLLIKPTFPSGPGQQNTASSRREFTLP